MARTAGTFQHGGETGNLNKSLAFQTLWIDFLNGWCKNIIDFALVQLFTIFLQCARITHQIVRSVKLHRVDENAGDYHISPGFCLIDQLHMAVVQISHGGNQCDAFTFLTQTTNMLAQQRQGFNN